MDKTWGRRRSAALLLVLLLGGCSAVFRAPEVRLEGMRLGGVGLRGATLVARLHVTNPNDYGLEARSITYDLEIRNQQEGGGDWVQLTKGRVDQEIGVEGNAQTIVEVPIEFRYSDLGPAVRSLVDQGTFAYRVSGEIQVTEPISRTVPYRRSGTVSLEGVR